MQKPESPDLKPSSSPSPLVNIFKLDNKRHQKSVVNNLNKWLNVWPTLPLIVPSVLFTKQLTTACKFLLLSR